MAEACNGNHSVLQLACKPEPWSVDNATMSMWTETRNGIHSELNRTNGLVEDYSELLRRYRVELRSEKNLHSQTRSQLLREQHRTRAAEQNHEQAQGALEKLEIALWIIGPAATMFFVCYLLTTTAACILYRIRKRERIANELFIQGDPATNGAEHRNSELVVVGRPLEQPGDVDQAEADGFVESVALGVAKSSQAPKQA